MTGTESIGALLLESARSRFQSQKRLAERAFAQIDFEQMRRPLDPRTNSIAVIMKHMAGNMLSRWTDFLTTDGEKPWRDRDSEFVDSFQSQDELADFWERGWHCLFATIDSLKCDDLSKTVFIRGEPHTVLDAIHRQLDHYGYHVGQIVMIARIHAGDQWKILTIPLGASAEYNRGNWKS
jgi:uncharacterized damage-inducible protein DinB